MTVWYKTYELCIVFVKIYENGWKWCGLGRFNVTLYCLCIVYVCTDNRVTMILFFKKGQTVWIHNLTAFNALVLFLLSQELDVLLKGDATQFTIRNCVAGTSIFLVIYGLNRQGDTICRSQQLTVQTNAPIATPVIVIQWDIIFYFMLFSLVKISLQKCSPFRNLL